MWCLENNDLENDDLENNDLESDDLENNDLENDDLKKNRGKGGWGLNRSVRNAPSPDRGETSSTLRLQFHPFIP